MTWWRELRMTARRLARRPVFTTSAIALIGGTLGIAVTVGTIAHATLWSPLPYPDEDRLFALRWSRLELGIPDMALSLVGVREMPERTEIFDGIAATETPIDVTWLTAEGPAHLRAGTATPETFRVLGLQPLLGRAFTPDEGERGSATSAVVVSHEAWVARMGGDADALGSTLTIDGAPRTVVGILPPRRSLAPEQAEPIEVWFPMGVAEELFGAPVFSLPGARTLRATARLRADVTEAALTQELDRIERGLAESYPESHEGWELHAEPLRDRILGRTDDAVSVLVLGAWILFGVALVNLGGLFVHRAEEEGTEVATRLALGAGPGAVRRMRALDALVIGSAGASVAGALVAAGLAGLSRWDPLGLPAHVEPTLGLGHVLLVLGGGIGAALGVASAAALVSDRVATARLSGAAHTRGAPRRSVAARAALVLQVGMTTFLAVGAASVARSLAALRATEIGMEPEGIISARLDVPADLMPVAEVAGRARDVLERVSASREVDRAFVWSPQIPAEARTYTRLRLEDPPPGQDDDLAVARYHTTSPGAVTAFGMEVVLGRDISTEDREAGRRVALVSVDAARQWWGDESTALGRRIQRTSHDAWSEVVGVVADVRHSGRFGPGSDNRADVYFMFDQDPRSRVLLFVSGPSGADPVGALRAAVRAAFPTLALYDVRAMSGRLREQETVHRSTSAFAGLFAGVSLLLAAVGLAGSSALLVTRRTTEMGIRQALGAAPRDVLRDLTIGSSVGVVLGILAGVGLARPALAVLDPTVLTVGPADAPSYLIATAVVGLAGAVALVVPSLSGLRLAPAECLRRGGGG